MVAYGSPPAVDPTKAWDRKQYARKVKGMSREELRETYGAEKHNARPRREQPVIGRMSTHKSNVWETVLSPIYKAMDAALIGKAIYPDKADASPLYAVGERLTIRANEQDYRVTIKTAAYVMGFIRYILTLDDFDAELSNVTEAQLVQVVKPAATPVTAIVVYNPNAAEYRTTQRRADDATANEAELQAKIAHLRNDRPQRETNWGFVFGTMAGWVESDNDHAANWAAVGY